MPGATDGATEVAEGAIDVFDATDVAEGAREVALGTYSTLGAPAFDGTTCRRGVPAGETDGKVRAPELLSLPDAEATFSAVNGALDPEVTSALRLPRKMLSA